MPDEQILVPQVELAAIVMDEKGDVLIGRAKEGIDKDRMTVPISAIQPFESLSDAAKRIVFEWARVDVSPQHAMFVCEAINQEQQSHRIVVFVFAKPLGRKLRAEDAMWVNVKDLGDYQDQMSELAVDGFYKLSLVFKQQAQKADVPTSQA